MRRQSGPASGDHAVSAQSLLEQAIDRLPAGCVVVADANFGVFSVAYAATQRGHPAALMSRAKALAKAALRGGMHLRLRPEPPSQEPRHRAHLPADPYAAGGPIVP